MAVAIMLVLLRTLLFASPSCWSKRATRSLRCAIRSPALANSRAADCPVSLVHPYTPLEAYYVLFAPLLRFRCWVHLEAFCSP
ncbi:hypothetical protein CPB85DRAFT_1371106, partial [Mucidula mucida]